MNQFARHINTSSGLVLALLCIACGTPVPPGAAFREVPRGQTGIDFRNLLIEKETFNIFKYQYFYNGGGVAVGDFNNDGLQDLVFTGNMVKNRLYLNKGDFHFQDITAEAGIAALEGWCTGVTPVDINADGWLDLYICRAGYPFDHLRKNLLFVNNGAIAPSGAVTFTEKAAEYGLDDAAHATHASFFDYDKDGDLDLFLLNHSTVEYSRGSLDIYSLHSKKNPAFTNKLLRNDSPLQGGGVRFIDVTESAGITSNVLTFSLGLSTCDVNRDGWPDIFVGNDFNEPDYLFLNRQDGTFREALAESFDHTSLFTMGCDVADVNGDALPDLVTLDMLPESNRLQKLHSGADNFDKVDRLRRSGFFKQYSRNMLQIANGDGTFSETGQFAGISNTDWSWAALFFDFDNDGRRDLFVSNGYPRDHTDMDFLKFTADEVLRMQRGEDAVTFQEYLQKMPPIIEPNYFFKNEGGLKFSNQTAAWGLSKPLVTQSAAWADLDNDGDLDLVLNNTNDYSSVLENRAEQNAQNHWLRLRLRGPKTNPDGIGTQVSAWAGGRQFYVEQNPVRGFQASMDPVLHLGLGNIARIDSLLVLWPTGERQMLAGLAANQTHTLNIAQATGKHHWAPPAAAPPLFQEKTEALSFRHVENENNDFKRQSLLPWFYSRQGPAVAVADVNGDGLDDAYLGGAKDQPGQLFVQKPDGNFVSKNCPAFAADAGSEDTGACFFDADGDGDADLYVVSGGYEFEENDPALQDRLYLGDGHGAFIRAAPERLPDWPKPGNSVQAADADGDGDTDLFVGGAYLPGKFPHSAPGRLLRNDGKGRFHADTLGLPDAQLGAWIDLDRDGLPELVTAGEWAPLRVFQNKKGVFREQPDAFGAENMSGLWCTLLAADLDGDGDPDLLAGNLGSNSQLQTKAGEPLDLWFDDFDRNGSVDPLLFYYVQGSSYPVVSMEDLTGQLPYLRKKYIYFKDYAEARVDDILTPAQQKSAGHRQAALLETMWLKNEGGRLEKRSLPAEVQCAPVHAAVVLDANADGHPDVLTAGNRSFARVKFGSLDGNHGLLLLGDGNGGFQPLPGPASGLNVRGDVRALRVLRAGGKTEVLFGVNDGAVRIFAGKTRTAPN